MTVREMIELLKGFDPETPCVYECCSDYAEFEEDVDYRFPNLKKLLHYDGRPIQYYGHQWDENSVNYKQGLRPDLRTYLVFPGN